MGLFTLIALLLVAGIVLYFVPCEARMKNIIYAVIVCALLFCLVKLILGLNLGGPRVV